MKIKAPQVSFFQACILAFLAIITACAVCSTVAIVRSANLPVAKASRASGNVETSDKLVAELGNINRSIRGVSSGLTEIDRQLGYLYNKPGSDSADALAGVVSVLNEICKELNGIHQTLIIMRR